MSDRSTVWQPKPDEIKDIPVGALHDFLTRRGWIQQPSTIPTMRYYEHSTMKLDDGRPLYYSVSASDHFPDYPLRVLQFVEDQAGFWELDPWAVIAELKGGPLAEPVRTSVPA